MVHPIFSVLIARPELVMEHAAGYASLMREEASSVGKEVAKRAIAWGVTLFAADPLEFKRIVTEMRFDEVSARYGLFGDFFVGRVVSPEAWVASIVDG